VVQIQDLSRSRGTAGVDRQSLCRLQLVVPSFWVAAKNTMFGRFVVHYRRLPPGRHDACAVGVIWTAGADLCVAIY
jgi:hypothetical protein